MVEVFGEPGFRRRLAVACLLTAILVHPAIVGATFSSTTTSVSMSVGTGSLSAPSGLVSVNGTCVANVSISANLSWTATPSSFADGYEILRGTSAGGPYTSIATVSGQGTTTYVNTSLDFLTTYYYVVRATKNNWRSADSNQSSVTTLSTLCL